MKKYTLFLTLALLLGAAYATPGIAVDFTLMQERLLNGTSSRERSPRLELRNTEARVAALRAEEEIIVRFKDQSLSERVRLPQGMSPDQALEIYRANPDIAYAEPNYIAQAFMVPNDPLYAYQWHLDNPVSGGIHAEEAWNISTGSGVTVAIIDTGVAYENYTDNRRNKYYRAPDLATALFAPGYDFVNNDTHPNDDEGHGTHITGTVAQSTNNNVGVAGIAYGARIMPIKVLDKNGSGTYMDVAEGIRFAADHDAKVINLSLGGPFPALYLEEALAYAYNKGVTIVAAAGNSGSSAPSYPAAYDDYVISVGATRFDETLASYSNYGPSVDVVAPGGDLSVDQNGDRYGDGILQQTFGNNLNDWGYYFYQGTSMATPHVTGTAALVIANGNATTPDEVRAAIESTAKDLGSSGRDNTYGSGLVNATAALGWNVGPVDNPPTVSLISPANASVITGAVTLSATANDDNGINEVVFKVDGSEVGSDTTAPYELIWNSANVSDGSHTISATAIDTALQTKSDSVTITVDNINDTPVANAGPDLSGYAGEAVVLNGSSSFDPDGSIVSYDWNFGDGSSASGATVSHTYTTIGLYTATLTVTDNDGATDTDTAEVLISDKPATPTLHVGDITFTYRQAGSSKRPSCRVSVSVPIRDSGNAPVGGTAIAGKWSDAYNRTVSGTTGSDGTVLFSTSYVRDCGTFTFTVTNASKEGWFYDSSQNVETSDSITL